MTRTVTRCREVARREWRRVVPVLELTAGLAAVDAQLLLDYCICVARIDQCERALSREGLLMPPKSTFFTPKLRTGLVIRPLS